MKRRNFIVKTGLCIVGTQLLPMNTFASVGQKGKVRLGGPILEEISGPDEWINTLKKNGYRAAYCPVSPGTSADIVRKYKEAANQNDILISEVGAWSNPISPKESEAKAAIQKCIDSLDLAEEIGACCCVNISGSRNPEYWAGPHMDNLSDETFDLVVESTRKIIDAVKPSQTFFALEAMPWSFPDSTETYLQLLKAIDRKAFGVHLDPVNMIRSPREYFYNGALIREMFSKMGPYIKSCHAKDIILREDNYIPQLDELRPGLGKLDYKVFLIELSKLKNVPLMMEHLNTTEEYALAASHIRSVGLEAGLEF